jgi:hypothetical protein
MKYDIFKKRDAALGYNFSFCFGSPSKTIEHNPQQGKIIWKNYIRIQIYVVT